MAAVLVVDDDPDIRALVRVTLEHAGHQITEAGSAAEGLEAIYQRMPDLILLDIVMPHMDGWRFLDELHARGLRSKTRVVIISGSTDERGVAEGKKLSFVAKPFDLDALTRAVDDALERSVERHIAERDHLPDLAITLATLNALDQ